MLEKSFGKHILALGAAILIVPSAQAQELKDEGDKLSYTIGNSWGKTLKREQIKPNYDILLKAIHDVVDGKPTTMTEDEMRSTIQEFTKKQQARREEERKVQEEERKKLGEKSKVEGEEFLAKKAKEDGIKKTASGLLYKVMKDGDGATPKPVDRVLCHYKGSLINGTEFDSSYKRGKDPASFAVSGVIKGWTEALQLMKVGAKWELYIPAELAYGERGTGNIPPNSTLIFEIELAGVKPGSEAPMPPVTSDIIKVPSAEELKKGAKIEVIKPEEVQKLQEEERKKNAQKEGEKK